MLLVLFVRIEDDFRFLVELGEGIRVGDFLFFLPVREPQRVVACLVLKVHQHPLVDTPVQRSLFLKRAQFNGYARQSFTAIELAGFSCTGMSGGIPPVRANTSLLTCSGGSGSVGIFRKKIRTWFLFCLFRARIAPFFSFIDVQNRAHVFCHFT